MAQYKLLEKSFINNRIFEAGETVEVNDSVEPGPHMVPLDDAAEKAAEKIGLVNGPLPDPVDLMTGGTVDVTQYGASPQIGQSGMALGEITD